MPSTTMPFDLRYFVIRLGPQDTVSVLWLQSCLDCRALAVLNVPSVPLQHFHPVCPVSNQPLCDGYRELQRQSRRSRRGCVIHASPNVVDQVLNACVSVDVRRVSFHVSWVRPFTNGNVTVERRQRKFVEIRASAQGFGFVCACFDRGRVHVD
jgi:hypothetical protein